MKKGVGAALALVLVIAVGLAVAFGNRVSDLFGTGQITHLRGAVGSEKEAFFRDQRVKDALRKQGFEVDVTPVGSRDIAKLPDLDSYDFVFPSSAPAADKIARAGKGKGVYSPFFTPLAIASFQPIVDLLAANGIATKQGDRWTFDMARYAELAAKGTRWDQLPGNTTYPARKSVLVTTTDVRRSNSAAMYLALTSYVAAGKVVTDQAQVNAVLPKVSPLFLDQGYVGGSTEGPFLDYLSAGMGKTPMVMIYESQFLERQIAKDGSIGKDMVLLYPGPDALSKHTLVALKDEATKLGDALTNDPELMRLAAAHGFRPQQRQVFTDALKEAGVAAPPELLDIVDPPTFETLEQLITGVEKLYG